MACVASQRPSQDSGEADFYLKKYKGYIFAFNEKQGLQEHTYIDHPDWRPISAYKEMRIVGAGLLRWLSYSGYLLIRKYKQQKKHRHIAGVYLTPCVAQS
jgi:hypothetical protein